jgi:hypothetical protein
MKESKVLVGIRTHSGEGQGSGPESDCKGCYEIGINRNILKVPIIKYSQWWETVFCLVYPIKTKHMYM